MKFKFSLLVLTLIFCWIPRYGMAQKPVIDETAIQTWPHLSQEQISNNGKFVVFTISSNSGSKVLCIKSSDNKIQKEISRGTNAVFSEDSHYLIYNSGTDSLFALNLIDFEPKFISTVISFKVPEHSNSGVIAFQTKDRRLCLYNLEKGTQRAFKNVGNYIFSPKGEVLAVEVTSDSNGVNSIVILDANNSSEITICRNIKLVTGKFDTSGFIFSFIGKQKINEKENNSIWVYKMGDINATQIVNDSVINSKFNLLISDNFININSSGKRIYFNISNRIRPAEPKHTGAEVDIWNYNNCYLRTQQVISYEAAKTRFYLTAVNLNDLSIFQLEQPNRAKVELSKGGDGDYALCISSVNISENYRNSNARPDIYLVNLNNGKIDYIEKQLLTQGAHLSPTGRYVLWFSLLKKSYFIYDSKLKSIINITKKIPVSFSIETWDLSSFAEDYQPVIWLNDDKGVLIQDRYDIWKIDFTANYTFTDISKGFGRKNKIIFRYIYKIGSNYLDEPPINENENLIVSGFNEITKQNGFFLIKIRDSSNPIKLTFTSDYYYYTNVYSSFYVPQFCKKAKDTNCYLIKRMNATEYPNLYTTGNFTQFIKLTNLRPQESYNWIRSKLITWNTFNGKIAQGILYAPEDFDSSKKYPVILNFYEKVSNGLNVFMEPGLCEGPINIPWFVSRGYLVFCPDIYYKVGDPGSGIYDYVTSAAEMLSRKHWIDKTSMGIQAHSWGGMEVNFLVTKTKMFKAAASASGYSDLISGAGSIGVAGKDNHTHIERGQYRMGSSVWETPSIYIKNSPVFNANRVFTPLLIMHNKADPIVPFSQAIEYFTSLRRLNKAVWLLQYDDGRHIVSGKSAEDYTKRLVQYFDYYLKGQQMPKWMSEGIPPGLKGIDQGFDFPNKN